MARMIPPVIDPSESPPGEVLIFDLLAKAPNTEEWVVLHSLDIPKHVRQVEGEMDFAVLVPGGAVVCLEVKSHEHIRVREGLWHMGGDPPTRRSPFVQANEAMQSTIARVKRETKFEGVPFVSAVAFPCCDFNAQSFEWETHEWFDETALAALGIVGVINRIVNGARRKLAAVPTAMWFRPGASEPTLDQCLELAETLRPSFERHRTPKQRRAAMQADLVRYTTEQYEALDYLEAAPRVVLSGAAGTGKTLLAVEAARRAVARGHTTLLCCYNSLLGRWLKDVAGPLEPAAHISTLHSLMVEVAGVAVPADAPSSFWQGELPDAACRQLSNGHPLSNHFDRLVIDEAQDVLTEPYLFFLDLLLKGGLRAGCFQMFGDFERQAIFTDLDTRTFLSEWADFIPVPLAKNCRNRPRVGHLAAAASGPGTPYKSFRRPDDGNDVKPVPYVNPEQQTVVLAAAIDKMRSDGFQLEDIVVLSPLAERAAVHQLGDPYANWLCKADQPRPAKIRWSSIHAFKGLDAPAVIVTDISSVSTTMDQMLLYIAASRATERLCLIADRSVGADLHRLISEGTP